MNNNKMVEWIKNHKDIIVGITIGINACLYHIVKSNTETSKLLLENVSLNELKNY